MFKMLYPYEYINSTYNIDFEKLYKMGFRGIIFDIDNTLVPHNAPSNDKVRNLFIRLKNIGFDTCILSNNKENRVVKFLDGIDSKYIYDAKKPSKPNYIRAMKLMKTNSDSTLMIGDQLFTDLWGANKVGIKSILTMPIEKDFEIQIVLKRILEKLVLFFYNRNKKYHHRLGNINKK